jgi:uncharacterized membrane protein YdbT with pleckstrin-like domain
MWRIPTHLWQLDMLLYFDCLGDCIDDFNIQVQCTALFTQWLYTQARVSSELYRVSYMARKRQLCVKLQFYILPYLALVLVYKGYLAYPILGYFLAMGMNTSPTNSHGKYTTPVVFCP